MEMFLSTDQTLDMVINWYKIYLNNKKMNMYDYSVNQIKDFEKIIKKKINESSHISRWIWN